MAVSATLGQLGPRYGIGTNVSAYLRSQWPRGVPSGAPSGGAVAGPVAIDTNGNATFAGLNPDTEYIIYANVSGQDVYTAFWAGTGGTMSSARDVEVVAGGGGGGGTVDTELPAAAALTDSMATPTAPAVAAFPMVYNPGGGAIWSRAVQAPGVQSAMSNTGVQVVALAGVGPAGNGRQLMVAALGGDADAGNNSLVVAPQLFNGATYDRARGPVVFKTIDNVALTAGTGATIWTPAAGKKFRLMGWSLALSVVGKFIFGDNVVGTVLLRTEKVGAAGISQQPPSFGNGLLSALANNVLKLDVSASGTVDGFVFGTEE